MANRKGKSKSQSRRRIRRAAPKQNRFSRAGRLVAVIAFVALLGLGSAYVYQTSQASLAPAVQEAKTANANETAVEDVNTAAAEAAKSAQEAKTAAEAAAEAANPDSIVSVVDAAIEGKLDNVTIVQNEVFVVDQETAYNGDLPGEAHFRADVKYEGEPGTFGLRFTKAYTDVTLIRVVPDDELVQAILQLPDEPALDITRLFSMGPMTATVPSDPDLRATLKARGAADTELLPQNYNALWLGDIPAGTLVIYKVKDVEGLGINRGLSLWFTQNFVDAHTIALNGKPGRGK